MKAEDPRLDDWLDDLLTSAQKIVEYTAAMDRQRFLTDEPVLHLVVKKIENMGEAVRYIRELHPDYHDRVPLPWRDMRRMRNRLVHGYFNIDELVLWETVRDDIPPLLDEIRRLTAAFRGSEE